MIRAFLILCLATLAVYCRAALPDAVVQACLTPTITDAISSQTWTVMTVDAWDTGAIHITETADAAISSKPGAPHPLDWATTEVSLSTPLDCTDGAAVRQTLTLKLTAKSVVPKLDCTITLLNQAHLPPCEITSWQGKLAIVSKAKDWYIVANDPEMTVTQTDEASPRTTLRRTKLIVEKFKSVEASILVGEGPLP